MKRRVGRLAALGAALLLGGLTVTATRAEAERPVVIIGFDGADARLVEQWMDAGELPNLAALRDEGTFTPLLPTNPPQTPVSWSSFATGTDPGKTEIFDFLKRNPSDYLPDFAMITPGKRTFMLGERTGLVVGIVTGTVVAVVLFLVMWLLPLGWLPRAIVAALLGLAAGGVAGSLASRWLPVEVPHVVNNRKGQTMWEIAAEAGHKVRVIRVPATFPADPVPGGHMVSGLGVPDMRGRIGTPAYYTSDASFQAGDNEFSLELIRLPARRGQIETRLVGPLNQPFYDYVVERRVADTPGAERAAARQDVRRQLDDAGVPSRLDLELALEATDTDVRIDLAGQSGTVRVGEWSDWFVLDFPVNPLIDLASPLQGMTRFKLLSLEPELQLYASPINFHPDCHPVAFTWPPDHSEELAREFGLYKTIGWALDTWSLPSGVGDEMLFLEDMDFTVSKYEEMLRGLLGSERHDLYVQIFYFTDRIGHLFWRFLDPGHPLYDPVAAERYAGRMLEAYKRMDDIVGEARRLAPPDALFIVCSDHGFSSYRRGVNYNNWLVENGLMTLKGQQPGEVATLEKLFETRELFGDVDWSRTKAYSMGLGSIYINLIGRERNGIVLPGPEYEEVRRQIKDGLEALVDPLTGERPVAHVWLREEMYGEFDPDLIPDLRAGNNLDYRVSWQTSLGGFGAEVVEDNTKPWSGDHCSNDPAQVRGIFFANQPIDTESPRMIDIMPTVLKALGLDVPPEVDGRPLL